jgi:hypothetical protein
MSAGERPKPRPRSERERARYELFEILDRGEPIPLRLRSAALAEESDGYLEFIPRRDLILTKAGRGLLSMLRSERALARKLAAIPYDAAEHAEAEELAAGMKP